MELVESRVTLRPFEARRLENWSIGFMWPCIGKESTTTWVRVASCSLSIFLSLFLSHSKNKKGLVISKKQGDYDASMLIGMFKI